MILNLSREYCKPYGGLGYFEGCLLAAFRCLLFSKMQPCLSHDLNYFSNNDYKLSKNAYYNKNKFKGGIHDSTIFEFIIKKIENLDLSKKHLITAFTLDTHAVDGYPSISCLKKIKDKKDLNNYIYQNTVKCTAEALAKFIEIFHVLRT